MKLAIVVLGGCATAATLGPVERFRVEGKTRVGIVGEDAPIGPGAKLDLAIHYHEPDIAPTDPPPWLTARGETVSHFELAIALDGKVALAGCPEWAPVGATPVVAGKQLETCAARFVRAPEAIVQVRANPAMAIEVVAPGWRESLDFSPEMTLTTMVAYAGTHARSGSRGEFDSRHVRLVTRDGRRFVIDVAAIATGDRPDVPLRPGDRISIEPR